MRAMDNFLNPAYTSSMQVTDVDKEIQRLYNQTGDGGVVPDRPQKYITVDGERVDLTGEQYVNMPRSEGRHSLSFWRNCWTAACTEALETRRRPRR